MVESSVKTISRPVINRLPVDVNQLDEFACRQLDRVCHSSWSFFFALHLLPFQKKIWWFFIHMEKFLNICAVSLTWDIFPPVISFLITLHFLSITARSVSPSVCQWKPKTIYVSRSLGSRSRKRETEIEDETLDGFALEDDEASSSRYHWGEGSFLIIILKDTCQRFHPK